MIKVLGPIKGNNDQKLEKKKVLWGCESIVRRIMLSLVGIETGEKDVQNYIEVRRVKNNR